MLPLDVPQEPLMRLIAELFVERMLGDDRLIDRVADVICARFELLDPPAMAAVISTSERALRQNHVKWGLDKSTAFGPTNPLYFLSQALERAKAQVIRGRRPQQPIALQVLGGAA